MLSHPGRTCIVALLGGLILSCGGNPSATEADGGFDAPPAEQRYQLSGSVVGLSEGSLYLQLNGDELHIADADGDFTFETDFVAGAIYSVEVLAEPERLGCRVDRGEGTVGTTNVVDVAVVCGFATADLSELVLSAPFAPAFNRDAIAYSVDLSAVVQKLRVTAVSADPGATILVNSEPVVSGTEVPISIPFGATHLVVAVTSSKGEEKLYHLEVRRSDFAASQTAFGKASNTDAGDHFAVAAISGDTLVIGAPSERSSAVGVNGNENDNMIEGAGAVYVFRRVNGTWSQEAYLKASNPSEFHQFGASVDIDGDVIVVGATGDDSGATGVNGDESSVTAPSSGAAYVFRRTNGSWSQEAYLKASNTRASELFGQDVAVSGDLIAVGALLEHSNAQGINGNESNTDCLSGCGAVYAFRRENGDWSQDAYIKGTNTGSGDRFGTSVDLSGSTLVVGVPLEDGAGTGVNAVDDPMAAESSSGAAYVFQRNATAWQQQAYIKPSDTQANGFFGGSLALDGDRLVVVAGGFESAVGAGRSGAAYVFARTGSTWVQEAQLRSPTNFSHVLAGPVAVSNDLVVVGASVSLPSAGGADVFGRSSTGEWTRRNVLVASNPEADDAFGRNVAISEDTIVVTSLEDSNATGMNGDQDSNAAEASGAFYVFE